MAATERSPNLENDLLDAEVGEFLQNYLQLSGEAQLRDSGIRLDMSDSSSDSSSSLPVTPLERLIRTHPIWFLPRVDRLEAAQILHLKETGNFIVRRCSQTDCRTAISVKLGYEHGFVVDHFVIKEREGRVSLKSSSLEFDTLLSLVYHHLSQVDSLPVVLALPSILRNTDTRQCLSSLALLGRDFWRYPMSNPGRQSLLIPATNRVSRVLTPEDSEVIASSITETRRRTASTSYYSPSLIRRNINITPTTARSSRHSFSYSHHPSLSAGRDSPRQVDSKVHEEGGMMHYFKSPTLDKISDYEDIWDKSPPPQQDPLTHQMISPTLSEQRFKNFLFNKIFDKNDSGSSHYESESDSPSYPTCSSSDIVTDYQDNDSDSLSSFSTESSEIDCLDTSEESEPLAALENLTDILAEDTDDELEIFDDLDSGENPPEECFVKDEVQNSSNETSSEVPPDIVSDIQSSKSSNSGSLTGLLRRLSVRRRPSLTRSRVRSEKRLSAVIGCYLTPSLLGMKIDDCQIDSSSWEFLDQSKEPGKTYFSHEKPQAGPDRCDSTLKSLCKTDETDSQHPTDSRVGSQELSVGRSGSEECSKDDATLRITELKREELNKNRSLSSNTTAASESSSEAGARKGKEKVHRPPYTETARTEEPSDPDTTESCNVIKACLRQLSSLETSVLGQIVRRFICCTVESELERPDVVMRNIRQVMTGLKNYLTITGEGELKEVVRRSGCQEVEHCLEEMMQELVVRPLSKHLHCLLLQERPGHCWHPPREVEAVTEAECLVNLAQQTQDRMREMFSAGDKLHCLEDLLTKISGLWVSVVEQCEAVRYLVVRTSWYQAGLEAQYIWGLMSPTLETRSLWSVCLLACAVYPLYSDSSFPILTILGPESSLALPCHPDITAGEILSLVSGQQTKQYSLSYRDGGRDVQIARDTRGLALFNLQRTDAVIISVTENP